MKLINKELNECTFNIYVKSCSLSGSFYLVYSLMLSRDTSYVRNRLFILISLASALIMPLVVFQNIRPVNIQFFGKFLSDVFITASPGKCPHSNRVLALSDSFSYHPYNLFYRTIIFLVRLFADLLNLLILIGRQRKAGCRIIEYHDFNTADSRQWDIFS